MALARCLSIALICTLLSAQDAARILERKTEARLREFAESAGGVTAVAAVDLRTGRTISVNGEVPLAQASVIKVPVLWRVMEAVDSGALRLEAEYTLTPAEAVGGSGGLQNQLKQGSVKLTLEELLRKMIEDSDNTATNKVIALAGMDSVNRSMQRMGLRHTLLQRIMMDTSAAQGNRENVSTALEMASLLRRVYDEWKAGTERGKRMVEWMKLVPGDVRKALPDVPVAAKTGGLAGVRNEAAIVFLERRPYALVVLQAFQREEQNRVGEIARILHDHFSRLAGANDFGHGVFEP